MRGREHEGLADGCLVVRAVPATPEPVRNPQRGEDQLHEAQQEVQLRQGASFFGQ